MRLLLYFTIYIVLTFLFGCGKKKQPTVTPWGTVIGDSVNSKAGFSLDDIISSGEMIVLTITGPDTYYDYRGHGMGGQYLLCERFAQHLGVSVRIEVCNDTTQMIKNLANGEADLIACPLPVGIGKRLGLIECNVGNEDSDEKWLVRKNCPELAKAINSWYKPGMLAEVTREENFLLSTRSIRRHVYSPMLSRADGVISHYDGYFKRHAQTARVDWRLMAAQCYQESCFDPNAVSWAGAKGLMQIMPTTADHLGLPRTMMHDPEANIAASARYMAELGHKFRDVPSAEQRIYFALACYNGGYHHIRDAMALAKKNGRDQYKWNEVSHYVLQLANPQFYRDPVVKFGYMRGEETVDYVERIRSRYNQYRGMTGGGGSFSIGNGNIDNLTPHKARHRHRFKI